MMNDKIKSGLLSLSYGLYVVTVTDGIRKNAMVASWVSQVSFSPPRIMVAIKKVRFAHKILTAAAEKDAVGFGLMVVKKGNENELSRIKVENQDVIFSENNVTTGKSGALLFTDYLCAFDLKLVETLDAGDHTIFIGEVLDVLITDDGKPSNTSDYHKVYIGDI